MREGEFGTKRVDWRLRAVATLDAIHGFTREAVIEILADALEEAYNRGGGSCYHGDYCVECAE